MLLADTSTPPTPAPVSTNTSALLPANTPVSTPAVRVTAQIPAPAPACGRTGPAGVLVQSN